jgi:hypothetical protein
MDEIICPECGRPNLIEAEKCWYCQVLLVSKEHIPDEQIEPDGERTGDEAANNKAADLKENEENIPEWLKHIRELKKADAPVEEVDEWQQEKLFPGLAQEADGPAGRSESITRPPKVPEKTDPKPVIDEGQPTLDEAPAEKGQDEGIQNDEEEPGDPENELPEGFTPLEH